MSVTSFATLLFWVLILIPRWKRDFVLIRTLLFEIFLLGKLYVEDCNKQSSLALDS